MQILAEQKSDLLLAKQALAQIEAAEGVLRQGGHTPNADHFDKQAVIARALVNELRRRET
jgi:hypothetical protein